MQGFNDPVVWEPRIRGLMAVGIAGVRADTRRSMRRDRRGEVCAGDRRMFPEPRIGVRKPRVDGAARPRERLPGAARSMTGVSTRGRSMLLFLSTGSAALSDYRESGVVS